VTREREGKRERGKERERERGREREREGESGRERGQLPLSLSRSLFPVSLLPLYISSSSVLRDS